MKKALRFSTILVIGCIIFFGCKQQQDKKTEVASNKVRYALFVHAGDESKPIYPLLIYTNEHDTSYYKYCKMDARGTIYKYGFPLTETLIEDMKKYYVTDSVFNLVSDYIIKNDPKKDDFNDISASGSYWVFFQDDQDSTIFTLDGGYGTCESCPFFQDLRKFVPEFDGSISD